MHHITNLHHIGHVVADIGAAMETYRRFGFLMDAPRFPAVARTADAVPRPFGIGNTHADFRRGFLELVTVADRGIPADATVVPLRVPEAQRPKVIEAIEQTAANLADCLARFEGVH
ncbi:MAG: VOC family protein, partial [Stackebrandtia sp.]